MASGDVTARQIGVELNVLHRSKSPYIVKFYGCFLAQTSVYYCMEYMDYGSLDRLYDGGVPEPVLSKITYAVRTSAHGSSACCRCLADASRHRAF